MIKNVFILNFFRLYNLIWSLVLPVLKKNKRLKPGILKRISSDHHSKAHIWIQAASAGEAYLAVRMVKDLSPQRPTRVLVTTITTQGKDILTRHLTKDQYSGHIDLNIEWFPFDIPRTVEQAVRQIQPVVMVLLETEIWPALLYHLKKTPAKILILNARLSKGSYPLYKKTRFLWNRLCPDEIYATSSLDARRYERIFRHSRVSTMSNIKFETMETAPAQTDQIEGLRPIFPRKMPVTILASIRKQEEKKVTHLIQQLMALFPGQVVALFPRHMHRIDAWKKHLNRIRQPFVLRSRITAPPSDPCIILWDTFGELNQAYALGRAVFVGGSIEPLGGQNFIEPAIQGTPTVIGPYFDDFAWTTNDIFTQGLVEQENSIESIAKTLAGYLSSPDNRTERIQRAADYIHAHKGGTKTACQAILNALDP